MQTFFQKVAFKIWLKIGFLQDFEQIENEISYFFKSSEAVADNQQNIF